MQNIMIAIKYSLQLKKWWDDLLLLVMVYKMYNLTIPTNASFSNLIRFFLFYAPLWVTFNDYELAPHILSFSNKSYCVNVIFFVPRNVTFIYLEEQSNNPFKSITSTSVKVLQHYLDHKLIWVFLFQSDKLMWFCITRDDGHWPKGLR